MVTCNCDKYKMYIVRDRETMRETYSCCQDCVQVFQFDDISKIYTVELVEEMKHEA